MLGQECAVGVLFWRVVSVPTKQRMLVFGKGREKGGLENIADVRLESKMADKRDKCFRLTVLIAGLNAKAFLSGLHAGFELLLLDVESVLLFISRLVLV